MNWPTITKETPIEELQKIHQSIWEYVIQHGIKPITPYESNCVACEYALIVAPKPARTRYDDICPYCPIKWPNDRICIDPDSIFSKWVRKFVPKDDEKQYATQIRDVSFKTKEELTWQK